MGRKGYVLGIDFGSDSVRAIVVQTEDGKIISEGTAFYTRWQKGLYQHPEDNIFRQHPLDYLESLELCVKEAVGSLDDLIRKEIKGIGIDTTGSTPVPINREGIPLALLDEFCECEDTMFYLWKDHSAAQEAEELNELFTVGTEEDYTRFQGKYCSEWYWAKILHAIRKNPDLKEKAYSWVEHCDWIVNVLTGRILPEEMYHGACAAGHKALWHSAWHGLPAIKCLEMADPYLALVAQRYGQEPLPATAKVGYLTTEWAERLGLSTQVVVSGSSFDAHAGAVGAGIKYGTLVSTLGTSAVDMIIEKPENLIGKHIIALCGQAENSIVEGYTGIETGQAAFGDIFAWYKNILLWSLTCDITSNTQDENALSLERIKRISENVFCRLEEEAKKLPEHPFPIALDWFNGRRYPNTNDRQQAIIANLSLGVSPPCIYRSLVFGAVCGLRRLIDGFEEEKLLIRDIIAVGGISKKSPYVMQMLADVLNKEVAILESDQTCALGAAIYAAVAAKEYQNIQSAMVKMSAQILRKYIPNEQEHIMYEKYYKQYLELAEKHTDTQR